MVRHRRSTESGSLRYFSTATATDLEPPDWRSRLRERALFSLPRASPDFQGRYHRVRQWLVEVDDAGQTVRELGLDEAGVPIVAGPWGRNLGFWTDIDGAPPEPGRVEIEQATFDEAWKAFAEQTDVSDIDQD